ncbi:hypothetical protein COY27_02875 [Candidatus Woesearchaeota archaeon CG_4_10_14_0_2_um_filter_33_13]|nr:MAG: hypothetical protein COY27_02875 [Candidatus Woesearchaeota archaeon CG_4_10_14_0_2_um_filter_33_13]
MKFKAKKSYGQYKTTKCPFCDRIATLKNEEGLDVCPQHTKSVLPEIKCTCGSWLEARSGKFGPYFNCLNCGNINYNKGMEIKALTMKGQPEKVIIEKPQSIFFRERIEVKGKTQTKERKEITISSNDSYYFD